MGNKFIEEIPWQGGIYREGVIGQPSILNPIISFHSPDKDIMALLFQNFRQISHCQLVNKKDYICSLKEGLRWSNGKPITSDDVIFTINLIQNPNISSYLYNFFKDIEVKKISQLKVKFVLKNPYSFFLDNLKKLYIIPKETFKDIPFSNLSLSKYNLAPISDGPFKFEKLKSKKNGYIYEYYLTKNKYYSQKSYLEKIIFKFYKNKDELINAYNKGEIDGFGSYAPLSFNKIKRNYKLKKFITPEFFALFLNQNNSLFQNKYIKDNILSSINKQEIIDKVLNKQGIVINSPQVLGSPYYIRIPLSNTQSGIQSKNENKDILKSISLSITLPNNPILKNTAKIIKDDLSRIIPEKNIKLNILSDREIKLAIQTRDYQILLIGIKPLANLDFFPLFHSSQKFDPGLNLSLYGNEKTDNLLEKIRKTFNSSEKEKYAKEFLEIISTDKPCLCLFSPLYFYVISPKVNGIKGQFIKDSAQRFDNICFWYINRKIFLK